MSRSEAFMLRARTITETVAMPDTCTVSTPGTRTSDGKGGSVLTPPTTITSPCWLRDAAGGTEQSIADRAGFQQPYAIDLPMSVAVPVSATITIGARSFEVGGVSTEGDWGLVTTAIVRQRG